MTIDNILVYLPAGYSGYHKYVISTNIMAYNFMSHYHRNFNEIFKCDNNIYSIMYTIKK